jgi:hypothetical protein
MYTFYVADLKLMNDFTFHGKKDASWGNNKHEPMSDSILPPFRDNVYVPSSVDFLSYVEDRYYQQCLILFPSIKNTISNV